MRVILAIDLSYSKGFRRICVTLPCFVKHFVCLISLRGLSKGDGESV